MIKSGFWQQKKVTEFLLCPLYPALGVAIVSSVIALYAGQFHFDSVMPMFIAAALISYFVAIVFAMPMLFIALFILPFNLITTSLIALMAGSVGLSSTWSLLASDGKTALDWSWPLILVGAGCGLLAGLVYGFRVKLPLRGTYNAITHQK